MAGMTRRGILRALRTALALGLAGALGAGLGLLVKRAVNAGASTASVQVVATSDHRDNSNGGSQAAANITRGLNPAAVLDIGDFASTDTDFTDHYKAFWGGFKPIMHAEPGNHELNYTNWQSFFTSAQIGSPPNYLQAVDLGAGWEFIGLEAFMEEGSIAVGSAKYNYLKSQLDAHPGPVIVGWHSPRYTWSTTPHTDWTGGAALYDLVKAHGKAIIIDGDQHGYQRLAEDGTDGVTEYVDAAGGAPLYPINTSAPGTRPALKAYDNTEFGVLLLTLRTDGYDWAYHAQSGVRDSGSKTFATPTPTPTPTSHVPIFADGFESGTLNRWTTHSGLVVESAATHSGGFAAEGKTTNGGTYAKKLLPATYAGGYGGVFFDLRSASSDTNLLRLRTAADSSLVYVGVTAAGKLDLATTSGTTVTRTITSATSVSKGTWHALELHAVVNGASSATEVWLDGVRVNDLSTTVDLGTTPIGKLQVGEVNTDGRTYDVVLDDAAFDTQRLGIS